MKKTLGKSQWPGRAQAHTHVLIGILNACMHTQTEKQMEDCVWGQTWKTVFYNKQKVHDGASEKPVIV